MKRNSLKKVKILCGIITMAGLSVFFPSCPQPEGENTWIGEFQFPPAAPAAPELRPGNKKLFLSWPAVQGANSYEVFWGETEPGAGAVPKTVNAPAADISGLENGTKYYVRLRAINSAGASGFSPTAEGTPSVQTPPPSVIRGDGTLLVGWAAEDGVDYQVWYGTSGDSAAAAEWKGGITRSGITAGATLTGLSNGTTWHVWINAGDGFGEETTGTPEAPPPVGGDFVYVPGGTVTGSSAYAFTVTVPDDPAYHNPGSSSFQKGVFVPDRGVGIDSLIMAKYETTQELWYTVQTWALGNGYQFQNPKNSAPTGEDKNKPVAGISWRDAVVWCNAYSEKDGKAPVYTYHGEVIRDSRNANATACDNAVMDKTKTGFRLPTEAEREFAARGGNPGQADWMYVYAGSNTAGDVAWHYGNSPGAVMEGGKKTANRLGVFDLSGNVQEWCWDWMNWAVELTAATPPDGAAYRGTSPFANQKAFNGGGVGSNPTMSCVAYRWGYAPDYTNNYVGFRVVRKP